jgi:hypothetical protein
MTVDEGRKPDGAPERSAKAGEDAHSSASRSTSGCQCKCRRAILGSLNKRSRLSQNRAAVQNLPATACAHRCSVERNDPPNAFLREGKRRRL